MRRCTTTLVLVSLLIAATAAAESVKRRSVASGPRWSVPQCSEVRGFPSVSVSLDGGRSVLPHEEAPDSGLQAYTFGLAALQQPNRLIAITGRTLLTSADGGCSWAIDGRFTFPQALYEFADAREEGVWAWSRVTPELFLFDHRGDLRKQAAAPVVTPLAFHADAKQLALVDDQGQIWWSDDAASTWQLHTISPARASLFTAMFSKRGRNHLIVAGLADGAYVTFDGGATWTRSGGLENLNVFRIAFSPIDPDVAWVVGLNPVVKGIERRAIYRSPDGGRTFEKVLTASERVPMTNGFTLAPSPDDPSLLYFALPGTSIYALDATGALRWTAEVAHRDVNAIVFSPASATVMYLGLKISDMTIELTPP